MRRRSSRSCRSIRCRSMKTMLRVTGVQPLNGHRLRVSFNDGVVREVDCSFLLSGTLGEALRDASYFVQARVDEEARTVVWPNGLDPPPRSPTATTSRRSARGSPRARSDRGHTAGDRAKDIILWPDPPETGRNQPVIAACRSAARARKPSKQAKLRAGSHPGGRGPLAPSTRSTAVPEISPESRCGFGARKVRRSAPMWSAGAPAPS